MSGQGCPGVGYSWESGWDGRDTLDVKHTFDDETAGFSDHPALQVTQEGNDEGPVIFLEKLGVSDPESVLLHGQSFTASALHNIVEKLSG